MEALQRSTNEAPSALDLAIERGLSHLSATQAESGAWLGDYGGPLFLLPNYVATCYATGVAIADDVRADMVRYLKNVQNQDGGYGLHIEGHSYMFTSVTNYVALRLLGVPADDPAVLRARRYIREGGGPLLAASWGKFLLTLLNLHDYRGLHPLQPELWLLPKELPFHPSRLWVHSRMVYLPMSYLYGHRVQMPLNTLLAELRVELYDRPYERIDWEKTRNLIAKSDEYRPLSNVFKAANVVLDAYEQKHSKLLRKRALSFVLDQVDREDHNTDYICVGPVNKCFNMWVWHHARPGGAEFQRHVKRLPDYIWKGKDGTKMQGYHSSQLWDTAFAVQATLATGEQKRFTSMLSRAHDFIDTNQVREDVPEREKSFRDPTKGGWGFSAKENTWIVSDCTAEGLRAALALRSFTKTPLDKSRCRDALNYLFWSQMECGGWASYEPARGPAWLEKLNPASIFGEIMIDYPYVECTSASVQAMRAFQRVFPGECDAQIERSIERAKSYLLSQQREDGSFEGSWGICFTYGTWFGIEGLRAAGLTADASPVQRACDFLEQMQQSDGGWGESADSNYHRRYIHTQGGQAVMTAWALLGLVAGGRAGSASAQRGVEFLIARQDSDGSYPDEHIAGMFNKTCAIHYDNYLKVFPLWALGEVRSHR